MPTVDRQKRALPKVGVTLKPLPTKYTGQPFKDISHSIFKNYINAIYKIGITTGYTKTTYAPNKNVNRGEMAIFLYRMAGSPSYNPPFNVFTDIKGLTNQKQILWLSASGITSGTGAHYNPHGNVTRGQMAAFLHRMAVKAGKAPASGKYNPYYADAKKHMFANDIGWLRSQGITDAPKSFNPDASMTRGEMAAFLHRFYNKFNKQSQPVVNKTSLKVKDSTLVVNDTWNAKDNFVSATDKNGKAVPFSQVKVNGTVDTTKAGIYTVTYSYGGKTAEATITVNENENKASIQLKEKEISKGLTATYGEVELRANIIGLTDKDGNDAVADKNNVTLEAKDAEGNPADLATLTQTEGTYTITYSYFGKKAEVKLVVDSHIPVLSEDKTTVNILNKEWSVIRGPQDMGENNYMLAMQEKIGKTNFKQVPNFFESNDLNLDGYLTSSVKSMIDNWYASNVKGTALEEYIQPVVLSNPTLEDMINIGVLTSNTSNGKSDDWWRSHAITYRTKVDATNGKKQAFALSSADVSTGIRDINKPETTTLTLGTINWENIINDNTTNNFVWLRSPGAHASSVAFVNPRDTIVGTGPLVDKAGNQGDVISALVVHIE